MSEATAQTPALSCRGVHVKYGGYVALAGIDLDLGTGSCTGLIGPNGAGKTTLLNALSGLAPLAGGEVRAGGRDITRWPAHRRVRAGLGRTFQITRVFGSMSVIDNLLLGTIGHGTAFPSLLPSRWGEPVLRARAQGVLEEIGLAEQASRPAALLAHGDRRALDIGIALMAEPAVLLLDEPLAGVGQAELDRAIALVARITRGRTTILIEHNMEALMHIADTIVVMVQGEILARGKPEAMRADPRVRAAYLGEAP